MEIFKDYEPKSCKDIYSAINSRQIKALMFHDQMADYFRFLGLEGFSWMHEYQHIAESMERRKVKQYYLKHHNKLLSDDEVDPVDVIPNGWYQYKRIDVTPQIRQQAIQKAMVEYKDWESDTKEFLQNCAAYLLGWRKIADYETVEELIEDVDEELKCLDSLCIKLKAVDYDPVYILDMQEGYCDKYKYKCSKIKIN